MSVLVIGLCGASGSGKGIVSALFEMRGIACLDTDSLYHQLTDHDSECARALITSFGEQIARPNGGIDRSALAQKIFSDETGDKYVELNRISHSFILAESRKWIREMQKQGRKAVCIDAPMLFESGFDRECDITVAVLAMEENRIRRIIKRDGITKEQAQKRLSHQLPNGELVSRCDFILFNNGSVNELKDKVNSLLEKIIL